MRILILGGTVFLGRHVAAAALDRGHALTLFHRGQHNPGLFPGAETILGDRKMDLSPLRNGAWDAVVDTPGYLPRDVRGSAEALGDRIGLYLFVSSISVYADFRSRGMTEDSPVGTLPDPTTETVDGETYGPLKALCEQAVQHLLPDRSLVVRPGLIVGPHDPTDRFTYWPVRVARGGDVLAPDRPDQGIQVIDVRDLAAWMLDLLERRATGVFNATSPPDLFTLGEVLESSRAVSGSDARFVWASPEFLEKHGVAPWSDMPVWVPPTEEHAGFNEVDVSRALEFGLRLRPMHETVADTLAWHRTRPPGTALRAGVSAEREQELLDAWRREPKE